MSPPAIHSQLTAVLSTEHTEPVVKYENVDGVEQGDTSLVILGDIAFAGGVEQAARTRGSSSLFELVPQGFLCTDVFCFNLECCLSERGAPWEPKPAVLRGLPSSLAALPVGPGQTVANLANNHFLDYGEDAAFDTLAALDSAGTAYCGAIGAVVKRQPTIIETDHARLAFLGYAPCAHPLPDSAVVNVSTSEPTRIQADIGWARQRADFVIVFLHQGVEYSSYVDTKSRKRARRVIEAGADCVICHHTHVIQGIEFHQGKPIFHGLGSFMMDVNPSEWDRASRSLALKIHLRSAKIMHVELHPIALSAGLQPFLLEGPERDAVLRRIERLSNLLRSDMGGILNATCAFSAAARRQIWAAILMAGKEGPKTACRYYAARALAKARGC